MYLIIHNPLSFNRKSKGATSRLVKFFQKKNVPFILRSTFKIDDLQGFLKANPTVTDIVYCGGDGTINYMINHVDVNAIKARIHFFQSGSGNDTLRTLKPIKKADVKLGRAVTEAGTVDFINGCGIGVDAAICHYVNADKHKNKLSYFINAFKGFSSFKPMKLSVEVDGVLHEYPKAYTIAIQNGRYFGGGMKATPDADPQSDTFQALVVHSISPALISFLFMTIYSGLHLRFTKYVTLLVGKHFKITCDAPQYFQNDGEVLEHVTTVDVTKSKTRTFYAFDYAETVKSNQN